MVKMNPNITTDAAGFTPTQRRRSVKQGDQTALRKYSAENQPPNTVQSIADVFGRFFEKPQYSLDPLEYPRDGDDPGLVLIFNQEHFEGCTARGGSTKDVRDIVTCFGRLGFNIKQENIFNDLPKNVLFEKIDEILRSDLSQINSVLVFILSHGNSCNVVNACESTFRLDYIFEKFGKCEKLKGKPKFFAIQACKGEQTTLGSTEDGDRLIVPLSTFEEVYPDMLIMYSTLEGTFAFRDSELGTWLIQEICQNFTAFGRRDDVLTLSARVVKCICTNYYNSTPGGRDVQKQIPVVVSTLSKKFYLNRNKDRDFTLRSIKEMNEILSFVNELSKKLRNDD